MVEEKLGAALKGVSVEHGLGGPEPGSRATYIAMGHLLLDSVEAFQAANRIDFSSTEEYIGDVSFFRSDSESIQI